MFFWCVDTTNSCWYQRVFIWQKYFKVNFVSQKDVCQEHFWTQYSWKNLRKTILFRKLELLQTQKHFFDVLWEKSCSMLATQFQVLYPFYCLSRTTKVHLLKCVHRKYCCLRGIEFYLNRFSTFSLQCEMWSSKQ